MMSACEMAVCYNVTEKGRVFVLENAINIYIATAFIVFTLGVVLWKFSSWGGK